MFKFSSMADMEWNIVAENYSQKDDIINCRSLCQGKRGFSSFSEYSNDTTDISLLQNSHKKFEIKKLRKFIRHLELTYLKYYARIATVDLFYFLAHTSFHTLECLEHWHTLVDRDS